MRWQPDLARDTDDSRSGASELERPPERIQAGPEHAGQPLADDDVLFRVARLEQAAAQNRNAVHAEEGGADAVAIASDSDRRAPVWRRNPPRRRPRSRSSSEGISRDSATAPISGHAATRASIAAVPRAMAAIDGNARSRPPRFTRTTPSSVSPRSASTSRTNDRTSSAEPTSSEQASAISTTSRPRVARRAARVSVSACRDPRSASTGSARVPSQAGNEAGEENRGHAEARRDEQRAQVDVDRVERAAEKEIDGTTDVSVQARPSARRHPGQPMSVCSAVACRIRRAARRAERRAEAELAPPRREVREEQAADVRAQHHEDERHAAEQQPQRLQRKIVESRLGQRLQVAARPGSCAEGGRAAAITTSCSSRRPSTARRA